MCVTSICRQREITNTRALASRLLIGKDERSQPATPHQEAIMIELTIHGSRGSVPVSNPACTRHGGATTCVELRLDASLPTLIIDCGTGLAELGRHWGPRSEALVLQSHFHWDHIQGFPFFGPIYQPGHRLE